MSRHGSHRHRRRRLLVGVAIAVALLAGIGAGLAAFRYLPALDDTKALRADLERLVDGIKAAGLGLDRPTLGALRDDYTSALASFNRLDALLAGDPLVAVARSVPPSRDAVAGADAVAAAGKDLLVAADAGLALAARFVAIKEQQATGGAGNGGALASLVELMATGRDDVDRVTAALDRAEVALAAAPAALPGPIAQVRDLMARRIADYAPLLRTYAELDDTLPGILGWDGPRRYLVLTQNPAELRPTGGYIGSFGVITFDRGRITEREFQDVFLLDLPWDYPFIVAPPALSRYLLGPKQPWQLADANWSPDFPTSARQAVRLYLNEGGQGPIEGVLGLTTYTIDQLLAITGPVAVPEYGVTIATGETTLKALQNTRVATDPATNRKAFLSVFADRLFDALFALPPARWAALAGEGERFVNERLLLAWFADAEAQRGITDLGLDGALRMDPGDFVYAVDSNVAPASKLNVVTDRALELDVRLDAFGNADNQLVVRWANRIETEDGRPYRELPTLEKYTTLGMYFRLYVPERSRVMEVSGGTTTPLTAPADVADESGRMVIANYFRIPPGSARLSYRWTSPYPAEEGEDGIFSYRLTIQKQPGLRSGPLALRITVPAGSTIVGSSPGLTVVGDAATVGVTFDRDIVVVVQYRLAIEEP